MNGLICSVVAVASQAMSASKEQWERLSRQFAVLMLACSRMSNGRACPCRLLLEVNFSYVTFCLHMIR